MYNTSQEWKNAIYGNVQSILNIYIDNVLVNANYILDFKVGQTLFNEELTLGSVGSKYIEFKIYKGQVSENINQVKVDYGILINGEYEIIPIGIFNIDDWEDNDDNTLTIKCIDNMSKFEFNYDGSKLSHPVTLLEILEDICDKAGVELGSTSFINSNTEISVYDNTVTAREYLSYISECAGGFACIGRDGKLYIRTLYQDEEMISLALFGEYKWGDKCKISKVSYENGVESFKFGDDTGNNLWLNQENMFLVDEEEVKNIYDELKNLEAYSFEGKTIIDPALDIGDKLIIDGKSVIYQGEATFQSRFIAEISSKIAIKQKQESTVREESQKVLNRRVQSRINEAEGKITQLVEETDENSQKLAQQQITLDGITQKVENVVETTKTVKGIQTITLDNCVDGNLLELRIFGHNTNHDFLFPSEDLFPSDDLFPNHDEKNMTAVYEIQVTNEDETSEVYRLAETYWLSKNSETQDLYELKDGKATITRRVNIYDGTTLEEEIEELGTKNITLKAGTNTITLLSHNANIEAKYAIKNEYTDRFATRVEMNSAIEQTESNINLNVNQKLKGYSTTEEMNSAIELATDEINAKVENVATYANVVNASGEAHLTETQEGTENIIELKIFGETTTGRLELVADKQSKNSGQSTNAFTHLFELEERLLEKNGVYDEIIIQDFKAKLIKRLAINESFISNSSFEVGNINFGGFEIDNEKMVRSDYTPILANKEYKITKKESDLVFMYAFFYNSSKEFISYTSIRNYQTPYSTTFTTPANSTYVRIVLNGSSYGAAIDFDVTKEEVVLKLNKDDVYELDEEMIIDLGTIKVKTFTNDTYIYIKNQTLNYYCRYLSDNDFTRIYAKKAEVKITTDNISSEVSKKVGKDEIKSQINQSAETVKIKANNIDINGVISANGNFKVGTDGKMECTGAKINVEDDGTDKESASIIAESANRIAKLTSFGLFIEPKASGHMTEYVNVGFGDLASVDSNGYGFNFAMTNYATSGGMKENRAYWNVKDSAGDLLFADDTQFNLFSPGENTNLSLRNNGAFINGYQIQTNASDRRLKTNIQDSTENALDKIMQIQHRSFDWKENGEHQKNGYIAQELEQIDEEFVIIDNDKYSINLLNVLSTVTKAMQEQQQQIEQLKQEQQEKQEQIEQLKQELNTLKGVEK